MRGKFQSIRNKKSYSKFATTRAVVMVKALLHEQKNGEGIAADKRGGVSSDNK